MKTGYAIIALMGLVLVSGCVGTATEQKGSPNTGEVETQASTVSEVHRVVLSIEGMYCPSCAYVAKAALLEKDGVTEAAVSYQKKQGIVTYDSGRISPEEIVDAIKPFTATVLEDKVLGG